jgi:cytochrome c oxidase subunit 4
MITNGLDPMSLHAATAPSPVGPEAGQDPGAHPGLAHVMPRRVLLAVWAALMALTILTVSAHAVDFGPSANLLVAMGIATVKASLVVLFFMHLLYDRRFHLLVFLASLLFVFLFVSLAMLDSAQYQPDIRARQTVLEQR